MYKIKYQISTADSGFFRIFSESYLLMLNEFYLNLYRVC